MQKLFLTFFGAGLLKPAPGTWGTLAAALVGIPILKYLSAETLFLISVLILLIAINVINDYEKKTGIHDHGSIVIDEAVGVWLAMSVSGQSWLAIILSIVFFRFFDIYKPSIIGRIDRNIKGGLGVMCDDVVAGGFAGLLSLMCIGAMIKFGLSGYIF